MTIISSLRSSTTWLIAFALLTSLSACANQLKVGKNDASISLLAVDGNTGMPGVTSIRADGCMLIIRNLALLDATEQSLENIHMETATCQFGLPEKE